MKTLLVRGSHILFLGILAFSAASCGKDTGGDTSGSDRAVVTHADCSGLSGPCSTNLQAVPLVGCSVSAYTMAVTLGDHQVFNLTMDSGSSGVAVAAATCSNCTGVSPLYQQDSTASVAPGSAESLYGDGSGWLGDIVSDTVQVAPSLGDVKLTFASITRQTSGRNGGTRFFRPSTCKGASVADSTQGIFGLANAALTPKGLGTYLDALAATGKANDVWSFQACDQSGKLWFGGYAPTAVSYSPVFTPMDLSQGYYTVTLSAVGLADADMGLTPNDFGPTIADTGTSFFLLPDPALTSLVNQIESDANFRQLLPSGFLTSGSCSPLSSFANAAAIDAFLPPLTLSFPAAGASGDVVVTLPATESYLTPVYDPSGELCYAGAVASSGPNASSGTILGNSLMHAHVVVFDRVKSQLGFAEQHSCP